MEIHLNFLTAWSIANWEWIKPSTEYWFRSARRSEQYCAQENITPRMFWLINSKLTYGAWWKFIMERSSTRQRHYLKDWIQFRDPFCMSLKLQKNAHLSITTSHHPLCEETLAYSGCYKNECWEKHTSYIKDSFHLFMMFLAFSVKGSTTSNCIVIAWKFIISKSYGSDPFFVWQMCTIVCRST